ncbi:S49 family peptidase [Carboxylicivirga marina]|uniref:S49 family peptidase n=1 Tax=Carboxylicivirga marina TaxID=2800988 RepID=UPI0025964C5D|nr:S49 family peptidase [uncultured Carboxylicivirga sp.]
MPIKHPFATSLFTEPLFMTPEARIQAITQLLMLEQGGEVEVIEYDTIASDTAERIARTSQINATTAFSDNAIDANSIAFHFVDGPIYANYDRWGWYFSTKQFNDDLKAADANEKIIGHFVYVNTGGGEAWFLDEAAKTMSELKKPLYVFIEKRCCSAGYYLSCNATKIIAATQNDTIGSIGTMVGFWDIIPAYEKAGFVWHEHYSTLSDLKNKKFNDLLNGKPEKYIKEELDPLAQQFRNAVRDARPALAKLKEDHAAFRGETFSTLRAIENGLIDCQMTLEEAIHELNKVALEKADTVNAVDKAFEIMQ